MIDLIFRENSHSKRFSAHTVVSNAWGKKKPFFFVVFAFFVSYPLAR